MRPNPDPVPSASLTRRGLLGGAGSLAALPVGAALAARPAGSWSADGLHAAASRKGLAYGSAVNITPLREDPAYGAALKRECGIVVAENEMKMVYAWPQRARFAFEGGDETLLFAQANGQRMRGHCLVWHRALPDWTGLELGSARDAEALMRRWITATASRYRGRIEAWDVVNEIVSLEDERPDGLRRTPWLAALGPRTIDLAFAMLRDADPGAAGVWNEDDVEMGSDWNEARRTRVLTLMEGLLKRGVPVRRFGLQSHLDSTKPFDAERLRRFLRELAGMGLALEVTEFDVDDRGFPADIARRDRGVSDLARAFLDVVLDEPAVLNVLTWDITNAGTWLNESARRRPDGLPQRALPLDEGYGRTPLWSAMRAAFTAAPDHGAARARLRGVA